MADSRSGFLVCGVFWGLGGCASNESSPSTSGADASAEGQTATADSASLTTSGGDVDDGSGGDTTSQGAADTSAGEEAGTTSADSTGGGGAACSIDEAPVSCTIYVSPDGNDGGRGNANDPLETVAAALDAAVPGDTICLRDGTYPQIRFRESGAPNAPITVRNEPGHSPVVMTGGNLVHGVLIQSSGGENDAIGWIVVAGLEITGSHDGIKMYSAHDVLIQGNYIHDNDNHGILGTSLRLTIDANIIASNGGTESSRKHGVYMSGTDATLTNNLITGNSGYGIQVAGYPFDAGAHATEEYSGARNWKIINNTIGEQVTRTGIVLWQGGTENALIANNVFWRSCDACPTAINDLSSGGGHTLRNNVFDNGTLTSNPDNADEEGNLNVDAMLVGGGNYHLADGSPAIGAGSLMDGPTHDLDFRLRDPARNDAGAYQFCP